MNIIDPVEFYSEKLMDELLLHIEEFACAFKKLTGLPADKIIMCHTVRWENDKFINQIWFEQKKEDDSSMHISGRDFRFAYENGRFPCKVIPTEKDDNG